MATKCPNCDFDNPSKSELCKECGTQLITLEEIPLHTKTLQTHAKKTIMDVYVGDIIDEKYKLIEELGSGGMGVVYKAEQLKPIKRSVAIKVIKLGMDTKEVVARFETEKQALAVMKHPNISKVIDAGATEKGRPYFIMELVAGIPITEYCDKHKLTTKERLELFIPVCQAVQHAHQKGVIHRDLKPSNVLVEIQEDKPVPKIIDFGIAKATEHRLTERTIFTERGQLIGTPEYMSPEQAEMSCLDVDTRTDIYSLGAILYELMVGVLPFDSKALREAGFSEIQRIIRETDLPKVSTRLGGLVDTKATIAEHRNTDPVSLQKQLKGDLDWIIMRAMEKDRIRRYDSASAFAEDIDRHLKHQPVVAGPPTAIYRAKKFVVRHKGGVVAAVTLALLILSFSIVVMVQSDRIAKERDEAKVARDESEAVTEFLSNMLSAVAPEEKGRDVLVRDVLDEAAKTIDREMRNNPLIEARLRGSIGGAYHALGLYSDAESHLPRALEIQDRLLSRENPITLMSTNRLGLLYEDQGRYDEAHLLLSQTLENRRRILGAEHPDTLTSLFNLGQIYMKQGKYDEAEATLSQALEIRRRIIGDEHPDMITSIGTLASLYHSQGRYKEAESGLLEMIGLSEKVNGAEHPDTLGAMSSLSVIYYEQGRFKEGAEYATQAANLAAVVFGEDHPKTLDCMNNLALIYLAQGRFEDAEPVWSEVLQLRRRTLGQEHPATLISMANLAVLYYRQDRIKDAIALLEETLEIRRRIMGDDHPDTLIGLNNLAFMYKTQRRYEDAEKLFIEAVESRRHALGEEHPDTLTSVKVLAELYDRMGRYREAESLYRNLLELARQTFLEDSTFTTTESELPIQLDRAYCGLSLGLNLMEQNRFADAEAPLLECVEICERELNPDHWLIHNARSALGASLAWQQKYEEAELLLVGSYKSLKKSSDAPDDEKRKALKRIVKLYEVWGKPEKAAEYRVLLKENEVSK